MITLVANTITQLLKSEKRPRIIRVFSDSTTATRIAKTQNDLEGSVSGHLLTAYESLLIYLPPNEELLAVSTGTPNLSWAEVSRSEIAKGALLV